MHRTAEAGHYLSVRWILIGELVLSIRTKPCFAKEKRTSAKSPKSSVLLESHLPSSVSIGTQSLSVFAARSLSKSH